MEYKPFDTSAETSAHSALETRLPAMLSRLADGMPASVGLADRVERQLTTSLRETRPTAHWRWSLPFGAPNLRERVASVVGLAMVVALIAGFAVVLRAHQGSSRPTDATGAKTASQATNCGPHGKLVGMVGPSHICTLYGARVSIETLDTYADTTRTSVKLRITLTNAQIPYGSPTRYSPISTVSASEIGLIFGYGPGQILGAWQASSSRNADGSYTEIATFGPLPYTIGAGPISVSLDILQLSVMDKQGRQAYIAGSWGATATLAVRARNTIPFHVAPLTRDGVTVLPLQLNVAPDVTAFDGFAGGDELIVQVSGLSPTMAISDVVAFNTQLYEWGPVPGASSTGSNAELTFEGREPAYITTAAYDLLSPSTRGSEVGPSGTLTLEITFLATPLPSLTGMQPLVISQFGSAQNAASNAIGPWQFQLPLN